MNPRTKRKLNKINERLELFYQTTRIIELSPNGVTLNSGVKLSSKDANKFIKRIMNDKVLDWVKNIDKLLTGEVSEHMIKAISFSIGGRACQAKHGEKLKRNLNTGISWNAGTKGQRIGTMLPRSTAVKQAISEKNSGRGNGRYGYRYSDDERLSKSKTMKNAILDGRFTPKLNNKNTHWESSLDGIMYRSSWEAWYKFINPNAIYESLRIPYILNGKENIYIVDFIDHCAKVVVEVKPKELCVGEKFSAKKQALISWAQQNNYTAMIVDKEWLQRNTTTMDYSRFDEATAKKIKDLYETIEKNRN